MRDDEMMRYLLSEEVDRRGVEYAWRKRREGLSILLTCARAPKYVQGRSVLRRVSVTVVGVGVH